jgi:conjugative transposon TraM protein
MKHTEQFLRKRKFLTALPVLVYPFLCLIFWSIGGGKVDAAPKVADDTKGFNSRLPDANVADNKEDLLSLYDRAEKDSAKLRELRQIEARNFGLDTASKVNPEGPVADIYGDYSNKVPGGKEPIDRKVKERLSLLQRQIDDASTPQMHDAPTLPANGYHGESSNLEQMKQLLSQSTGQAPPKDAELETLNGMLDKIIQIQNPEAAQRQLQEQSRKEAGRVFTTQEYHSKPSLTMSRLPGDTTQRKPTTHFYSVGAPAAVTVPHNAIKAIVYTGGKLASGATLQLMIQEDIYLNGVLVPKGSFVYGAAEVANQRVKVKVSSVGVGASVFKVDMNVFGLDAQEGIPAPGAVTRDQVKDGSASAVEALNMAAYDPSITAQAANAGLQTAKSLLTKKVKTVYATVPAGRQVWLVDSKQLNN